MSDVTIFTTGDRERGLGHIVRMKLLARLLFGRGVGVGFVSERDTPGWDLLAATGLPLCDQLPERGNVGIVDIEHGPDVALLDEMRGRFRRVVTVYGGHSFPLAAPDAVECLSDLVVCQSLFEFDRPAHVLQGTKWLLLDSQYAGNVPNADGPLVVCMGGTDPHHLTFKTAEALRDISRKTYMILGRPLAMPDNAGTWQIHVQQPSSLVTYLDGASLFIGALGMVAYEALAAGVPVILYSWSENHRATADELQRRGVGKSLGLWSDFDAGALRLCVETLLAERKLWPCYSGRARELVDGQGAARVADRIQELLNA